MHPAIIIAIVLLVAGIAIWYISTQNQDTSED